MGIHGAPGEERVQLQASSIGCLNVLSSPWQLSRSRKAAEPPVGNHEALSLRHVPFKLPSAHLDPQAPPAPVNPPASLPPPLPAGALPLCCPHQLIPGLEPRKSLG